MTMARKTKGPEKIEKMVETLRTWQGLERHAMDTTAEIMERTDNLVIREIMEIIRHDSLQHHRVQQFILDSFTKQSISLTPEEVGEIWEAIEAHDEMERETIELANEMLKDCQFPVQRVFLEYLLGEEEKHDKLLQRLNEVKKGMYPYGS